MKSGMKIKILAAIVAIVVGVLMYTYLKGIEESKPDYVVTIVAADNIGENTQITEKMLKKKKVLNSDIVPGAVNKAEDIIGKYASVNIGANEQILGIRLLDAAPDSDTENAFKYKIPDGKTTITVKTDNESAVAGLLKVGDKVDILVHYTPAKKEGEKENPKSVTKYLAYDVEIAALDKDIVKSVQKDSKSKTTTDENGNQTNTKNTITFKSVTLFVTPKQAQILNYCNNANIPLTFTLRAPNSETPAIVDTFSIDNLETFNADDANTNQ